MRQAIDQHISQLDADESAFVNDVMDKAMKLARLTRYGRMSLAGDDRAARAEDAIARWVIESR